MQFRYVVVKELRSRLEVSQKGLAKILYETARSDNFPYPEVSKTTIRLWEKGLRNPRREYAIYLEQIARDKGFLNLKFYQQD